MPLPPPTGDAVSPPQPGGCSRPLQLGVCYYPEQWPRERWAADARAMRELGLTTVRIAEFAWSRMEPAPGRFDWAWLDEAINTLAAEGLKVVLGTPTAAPPYWLIDEHPEILPVDARGQDKRFGSRRHYDFSSPAFETATRRIVSAIAARYGQHPAVVAWQLDNEYGCHDTILSYSPAALAGFRRWLAARYGHIDALNEAWGTAFWGLQLPGFEAVDLPVGQPASPLPAHALDFKRFASDEVRRYNRLQVDLIRQHSRQPVLHNFMGLFTDFDHHEVGADLDLAAWDSYPLGHVDTAATFLTEEERQRWARTGHPDLSAFHHDLYRSVGRGRFWVMEQQAGPVNWADWNALPLPGMVRAWTWEAFAHGAELVSYFRWRQLPFGQEQMHSGLHRPDGSADTGLHEAAQVQREIDALLSSHPESDWTPPRGDVALVLDYPSVWMSQIQPQGADMAGLGQHFRYYSVLRRLGLNVDVVGPDVDLSAYRLIVLPGVLQVNERLAASLAASSATVIIGPRTASKTAQHSIPATLPPGPLQAALACRVAGVESLRPGRRYAVPGGHGLRWRDLIELDAASPAQVEARYDDGWPAWVTQGRWHLHAGCVDETLLLNWLTRAAREAGLVLPTPTPLPEGLRLRQRGHWQFAINHGPATARVPLPEGCVCVIGSAELPPGGVALWRLPA